MKLTENEPKERTFTLELSETELRVLLAAAELAEFSAAAREANVTGEVAANHIDNFCGVARLLGVKP